MGITSAHPQLDGAVAALAAGSASRDRRRLPGGRGARLRGADAGRLGRSRAPSCRATGYGCREQRGPGRADLPAGDPLAADAARLVHVPAHAAALGALAPSGRAAGGPVVRSPRAVPPRARVVGGGSHATTRPSAREGSDRPGAGGAAVTVDAPVGFDPFEPGFVASPYEQYARLRAHDPVHWSPLVDGWVLTRFDDGSRCCATRRSASSCATPGRHPPSSGSASARARTGRSPDTLVLRDEPDHGRLRRLVQRPFGPRPVEALRRTVQQRVAEAFATLAARGSADLSRVRHPLPVAVFNDVLSLPTRTPSRCGDQGGDPRPTRSSTTPSTSVAGPSWTDVRAPGRVIESAYRPTTCSPRSSPPRTPATACPVTSWSPRWSPSTSPATSRRCR